MYEAVAEHPLFNHDNPVKVILAHIKDEPAKLAGSADVPVDLERVIMRCLEKDPLDRYDSAQKLLSDLENVRDGKPIGKRGPSP